MTLVLGYADGETGFLVSDTLLVPVHETSFGKGPVAGEFHGLKIQIVGPNLAIAFASRDDADSALEIIRSVAAVADTAPAATIPKLLQETYLTNRAGGRKLPDHDFLVLQIIDGVKTLVLVTASEVRKCQRAYIGDAAEYGRLMGLRHPYKSPAMQTIVDADGTSRLRPNFDSAGTEEFMIVCDAMDQLVAQRRGTVGAIAGCILRVRDASISKRLEYLQQKEASVFPWEGRTNYSLLASNEGQRGVGIYYSWGRVGFVMVVGDAAHLHRIAASTENEFIAIAAQRFGLTLC